MDRLDILIRRSEAETICEFLRQYREQLAGSDYPPWQYRKDAVDNALVILENKLK